MWALGSHAPYKFCQTWWWRTSENECKWFIAIWFILLKQINKHDNGITVNDGLITLIIFTHTAKGHFYSTLKTLSNPHSVHNGSSLSCLTLLAVFFPHHDAVVSFSAGSWLLILLSAWGAGPYLTLPTQVDQISLGFQATSHLSVWYTNSGWNLG
jgi:hypothetical protein